MILSGKKITISVLTYYINEKTNHEIRQGKLYLAVVPEEIRLLLLDGPGKWDGNGILYNLNLSEGTTTLATKLNLKFSSAKECHNEFWRWLMDTGSSKLSHYFGRADSLVIEADEAVGNDVNLSDWAQKIGRRLEIPLDKKIITVAICADLKIKKNSSFGL